MQCTAALDMDRIENHLVCPVSGVRSPASVDKVVTLFIDRSSPNLEHSFSVWCANKDILRLTLVATVTKIWEF